MRATGSRGASIATTSSWRRAQRRPRSVCPAKGNRRGPGRGPVRARHRVRLPAARGCRTALSLPAHLHRPRLLRAARVGIGDARRSRPGRGSAVPGLSPGLGALLSAGLGPARSTLPGGAGAFRRRARPTRRRTRTGAELWKRSVVFVLSDHGEGFDVEHGRIHHGGRLHADQLHIPLLVRVPGQTPRDETAPVSLVDLMPTDPRADRNASGCRSGRSFLRRNAPRGPAPSGGEAPVLHGAPLHLERRGGAAARARSGTPTPRGSRHRRTVLVHPGALERRAVRHARGSPATAEPRPGGGGPRQPTASSSPGAPAGRPRRTRSSRTKNSPGSFARSATPSRLAGEPSCRGKNPIGPKGPRDRREWRRGSSGASGDCCC